MAERNGSARHRPSPAGMPLTGRTARWASWGMLLVVMGICSLSLVSIHRLVVATAAAQRTSTLTDHYQDARYHVASADTHYHAYLSTPHARLLQARNDELRLLSAALASAEASPGSDHRAAHQQVLVDVSRYTDATDRALELVDLPPGLVRQSLLAAARQRADVTQAALTNSLGALQEATHDESEKYLDQASSQAILLSRGAPVVLAASLLLALLFGSVRRRHRLAIEALAATDPLTQLPNRLVLARRAAEVLDSRTASASPPCLLVLGLDRFKEVNDSLGRHYGDDLLVQVSERLRTVVNHDTLVARLGGDEFALLLSSGGEEAGERVAAQVKAAFDTPFLLDTLSVEVAVSIGIAAATEEFHDLVPLLRSADVAMYVAKDTHERYVVYTAEHDLHTANKVRLMSELRQALTADELVVHYQPKVALTDGHLVGVEALVRWQHPHRGLLAPGAFVPAVEDSDLMDRVTTQVLSKALRQVNTWSLQGRSVPTAVNIPTRSLLNLDFPAQVATLLSDADVDANMLSLEITESSAMRDPQRCIRVLQALRATGVRVSIDDYGTGYASMAYLKDLPVDEVKIDRSYVDRVIDDPQSAILARSIIELGHNLGLTVVGEGVEDQEVATLLREAGCDTAQGYHFARPMAGPDVTTWDYQRTVRTLGVPHPRDGAATS
ncbi:MAG: Diguanylate kinase [Frankiales bacterium]|nr:Diguanylate kinase [Frankiales bacterium]